MPGFNRRGPLGDGPMTGGGRGYCTGSGSGYRGGRGFTAGFDRDSASELSRLRAQADSIREMLEEINRRIAKIQKT